MEAPPEGNETFGGEIIAFLAAMRDHWVWWVAGSFPSAAIALYQGGGGVIPAWCLWTWALLGLLCAAFLAWREQYRKYQSLVGKTQIEAIDDLMSEFRELEEWYGSDEKTNPKPLQLLIVKTLRELRHHAPSVVYRFKSTASDPMARHERHYPKQARTLEEVAAWTTDKDREACWSTTSACIYELRQIRLECIAAPAAR